MTNLASRASSRCSSPARNRTPPPGRLHLNLHHFDNQSASYLDRVVATTTVYPRLLEISNIVTFRPGHHKQEHVPASSNHSLYLMKVDCAHTWMSRRISESLHYQCCGTHAVKEVSDSHFGNNSYSHFKIACSTNVHRATMQSLKKFETSSQRIRWHTTQLRHVDSSQSSTFQNSPALRSIKKHPVCIRRIVDLFHLQDRSSQESSEFGYFTHFRPDPLTFGLHRPNRLVSFSTISAAAAATAETAESLPKILVCRLLTMGQSIRIFITKHPSRCSPSFVVVVVTIAESKTDLHVLTGSGFGFSQMVL